MMTPDSSIPLPPSANYRPFETGRYEVAPGLSRFGKDFGNASADRAVFQLDAEFARYHQAKCDSRRESLEKYYLTHELRAPVRRRVAGFILDRLTAEHPSLFAMIGRTLDCKLTGQRLTFDDELNLSGIDAPCPPVPPCRDALDALALQVQEDLAVISAEGERHWISALHVCLPNHWAPTEKIGGTFASIHEPVAGMADMNARQRDFVRIMIGATEGLVRFAWGIDTDDALNRHPLRDLPRTRDFDPDHPKVFVRVERQTVWGFPDVSAALFTIRTYFVDMHDVRANPLLRQRLAMALRSMSVDSLTYKGLERIQPALLRWLEDADGKAMG